MWGTSSRLENWKNNVFWGLQKEDAELYSGLWSTRKICILDWQLTLSLPYWVQSSWPYKQPRRTCIISVIIALFTNLNHCSQWRLRSTYYRLGDFWTCQYDGRKPSSQKVFQLGRSRWVAWACLQHKCTTCWGIGVIQLSLSSGQVDGKDRDGCW